MQKLWKAIDHNRYLAMALVLAALTAILFTSCAPRTQSIIEPGKMVTSAELEREAIEIQADYDKALDSLEVAQADLAAKYAKRRKVIEIAGALGQAAIEGAVSPTAGLAALLQIATLGAAAGAVVDNRRKDKVIALKKAEAEAKS